MCYVWRKIVCVDVAKTRKPKSAYYRSEGLLWLKRGNPRSHKCDLCKNYAKRWVYDPTIHPEEAEYDPVSFMHHGPTVTDWSPMCDSCAAFYLETAAYYMSTPVPRFTRRVFWVDSYTTRYRGGETVFARWVRERTPIR